MPRRIDHHDRGAQEVVSFARVQAFLPAVIRDYILHFEAEIERAVRDFAASLPERVRVLDAGAGEGKYRRHFAQQRYCGIDLAIGDVHWDYSQLDVQGDLAALPFRDATFDACLSIVTLEHVREPLQVVREMARSLAPGGKLLLIAPHEWEEHQQPHDYFRYTRYGLDYLLKEANLEVLEIRPVVCFRGACSTRCSSFRYSCSRWRRCLPLPLDFCCLC